MANEEKKYTPEFKAKVALEAISQQKKNLDQLSDKYDVPVSTILTWAVQLENDATELYSSSEEAEHIEEHIADHESVDVNIDDQKVADSISYGVMQDKLNYKRLVFWSVLGMALVVIFVVALFQMFEYNEAVTRDRVSESSEYYQINQLNKEAEERLNNFGVIDAEEGIYHIPIDSAINDIAAGDTN